MARQLKKPVLVIGGAGFIGSHLCEYFLEKGHRVIALDNFITGSRKNIAHLAPRRGFSLIRHDISKPIRIPGPIGAVLNFASPASPPDYLKYPIQTMKVGALGTHNALGIALAKKAKFLLASTSEVYGDPRVSPQPESYWGNVNPVGPRGVYDEAKRFAEALSLAYHREHRVDVKIVRIFNTYGRRMRPEDGRVIPNFITQALLGKPVTVYGDGGQTRSYCYVDDLVDGIDRLLGSSLNRPVNIGNPNEMSVLKLAQVIIDLTGSASAIVHKSLPVDDPKQRCPDIALAKKELGWAPRVALREGLEKTIAYFRQEVLKSRV
ncbi:MAG TPA: UDP-glucuronic acid decarboxylase family protein [Candidatus Eisenbacteria bacterium]|nr:UDP-glucuronic acid decarboxylase family protein [Candidatus Eisenbacteria bacterium]